MQAISANRRQPFAYDRVLLSAPQQGWVALQLGAGGHGDHLLLRNLSGELNTLAFELTLDMVGLSYRLHEQGRTVGAYESNLPFCISARLHQLQTPQDLARLDLAETLDRYVLQRYHERLHGTALDDSDDIPDRLLEVYQGSVTALRPVLRPAVPAGYAAGLLSIGVNPEMAFWRLVDLLDLPHLPSPAQADSFTPTQIVPVRGSAQTVESLPADGLRQNWQQAAALFAARPVYR